MITGSQDTDWTDEDQLLSELYPQLTEDLAAQYAEEYDTGAGRARFTAWLDQHTEPAGNDTGGAPVPPQDDDVPGRIDIHGDVYLAGTAPPEAGPSGSIYPVLDRLEEHEMSARRHRAEVGRTALVVMTVFAVLSLALLAFTPHFGVPLVISVTVLAGLVAAVAAWVIGPPIAAGGHRDLLENIRSGPAKAPAATGPNPAQRTETGDDIAASQLRDTVDHIRAGLSSYLQAGEGSGRDAEEAPSRPDSGNASGLLVPPAVVSTPFYHPVSHDPGWEQGNHLGSGLIRGGSGRITSTEGRGATC